ncbi:uncharacterized protein FIBRA_02847 [Fibroporia radiculosa]|uniref:Protein kinase domain-containing protein n=1 Tax=Fibroporia radiculosa TaxID=599839 RepID=J4GN56_9APHY|nr:uncharacterized protein FIBRA_02847 [Fibroporia radiculosa]CCM00805.1 predicted protein [Fibroporia radiculosa]
MASMASRIPDLRGMAIDDGRYKLTQLLGAGASGAVYRATDFLAETADAAQRAIKVLPKTNASKDVIIRQHREAFLHQRVSDHPNVLSLHDAFEDEDFIFLVMDYCPGGDLFHFICEENAYFLNDELVRSVFVQILDAVHACHAQGVYHRDLKPENILCSADGSEIYIADFGLATDAEESYTFGCGSLQYMSPECNGQDYDCNIPYVPKDCDIWALGIILVNMLINCQPWESPTQSDQYFADFLLHRDDYFDRMPFLSKTASALLSCMFELNPKYRMNIPELRKTILGIETFFAVDDQLPTANAMLQRLDGVLDSLLHEDDEECYGSLPEDMAEEVLEEEVTVEEVIVHEAVVIEEIVTVEEVDLSQLHPDNYYKMQEMGSSVSAFVAAYGDDCESATTSTTCSDSSGPPTPGTYAHDPQIEIPDIMEGEGLGQIRVRLPSPARPSKKLEERPSPALNILEHLGMAAPV